MEIKLYQSDKIRIKSSASKDNFIDVKGVMWDYALAVDLYPTFHYIEVREKAGFVRVFLWASKGAKHEIEARVDYPDIWWRDAEVVYSLNKVKQK